MVNKFFSLFHGETVQIASGKKVVPGESIAVLVDAQEVFEQTKAQSEAYKMEVVATCEKLKEQARQEGFAKGHQEWMEKIAELEAEIQKVRKDTEALILPIALKAAQKILGREIELSKTTVIDIIIASLKSVASHKKVKVYVNRREFDVIEKNKEQLKAVFENLEVFSLVPQENIEPGGCIIETEGGIINAQLENQWMVLENAFQRLLKPNKTDIPPKESAKKESPMTPKQEEKTTPQRVEPAPQKTPPMGAPTEAPEELEDDWEEDTYEWDEEETEEESKE